MKKDHKAFEAWAKPLLEKYQDLLLLQDHVLSFEYRDNMKALMEHGFNFPYKMTAIYYGDAALKDFKDKKYSDLKDVLVHELCHSITDPLYSVACDRYTTQDHLNEQRERCTDHIANVISKSGLV